MLGQRGNGSQCRDAGEAAVWPDRGARGRLGAASEPRPCWVLEASMSPGLISNIAIF